MPKFNVVVVSYEIAMIDAAFLKKVEWETLIIDEAHRLKNGQSKFFREASLFQSRYKILLTGTPLQNNILELITLVSFIAPEQVAQFKKIESVRRFLELNKSVQSV